MGRHLILYTPSTVVNYITKSSERPKFQTETIRKLKENRGCTDELNRRLKNCMREVSEAEAFFRLDPELTLSETNLNVVFVNTALPQKRTGSYVRTEDENDVSTNLAGKPGQFVRTSGLLDKYQNR